MDEVIVSIAGEQHWLWRAVDQNGFVLDVLVQRRQLNELGVRKPLNAGHVDFS